MPGSCISQEAVPSPRSALAKKLRRYREVAPPRSGHVATTLPVASEAASRGRLSGPWPVARNRLSRDTRDVECGFEIAVRLPGDGDGTACRLTGELARNGAFLCLALSLGVPLPAHASAVLSRLRGGTGAPYGAIWHPPRALASPALEPLSGGDSLRLALQSLVAAGDARLWRKR